MIFYLFVLAVFILSVELFLISSITSFFQRKLVAIDFIKLCLVFGTTSSVLWIGLLMGRLIGDFIPDLRNWYAASVFFILFLKLLYDGIKLAKSKRTINPLHKEGLIILTLFSTINSIFVGIGFGLLSLTWIDYFWGVFLLFIGLLSGYLWGLKANKLVGKHLEILAAIIYLIIAILVIINS